MQIEAILERAVDSPIEVCLLGLFPYPPKRKVWNKFIDLAMALAKRQVAMAWKSNMGLQIDTWRRDVTNWAEAEGRELSREEARGLRHRPIADQWKELVHAWEFPIQASSEDEGAGEAATPERTPTAT